jgi:hypothetical protein
MASQSGRLSLLSIVAIACILVCFGTAVWPNIHSGSALTLLTGAALFTPVLSVPFIVLWFFGRNVRSALLEKLFVLAMLAALGWWCFVFWDSFLVPENLDAQGGLVFFFAPLYSTIAAGITGKALVILDAK